MFWGLVVKPGKRYESEVKRAVESAEAFSNATFFDRALTKSSQGEKCFPTYKSLSGAQYCWRKGWNSITM